MFEVVVGCVAGCGWVVREEQVAWCALLAPRSSLKSLVESRWAGASRAWADQPLSCIHTVLYHDSGLLSHDTSDGDYQMQTARDVTSHAERSL